MSASRSGRPCFAIVRRGELGVFETLKTELEEPAVVQVIWDRRRHERRSRMWLVVAEDRRRRDRRGRPPAIWSRFGFVVAVQRA